MYMYIMYTVGTKSGPGIKITHINFFSLPICIVEMVFLCWYITILYLIFSKIEYTDWNLSSS